MPGPLDSRDQGAWSRERAPTSVPEGWVSRDGDRLWNAGWFEPVLVELGWNNFDALFDAAVGEDVREIGARRTTRVTLTPGTSSRAERRQLDEVYLKRFGPLPWRERLKNWIRFRAPDHGAAPEFQAILGLTRLGIPTVEPLAFGRCGGRSLLVTAGLTGYRDLKAMLRAGDPLLAEGPLRRRIVLWLADLARTLHSAGYHHQDFYLNHILVGPPRAGTPSVAGAPSEVDLRLIDLGRVRRQWPLGRRWIVKDLAQLHYSSEGASSTERLRFLVGYLGRPLASSDRPLIRAIVTKSAAIARHTRRHGL